MEDDPRSPGPLRFAIAEMRAELDGMIDRENARLLGEAPARPRLAFEEEGGGVPMPRAPGEPRAEPAPPPVPRPPREASRTGPSLGAGPRAVPGDEAGLGPSEDDSERRLDALAARLEGRLRRARDRSTDRPGTEDAAGRSPGAGAARGDARPGGEGA